MKFFISDTIVFKFTINVRRLNSKEMMIEDDDVRDVVVQCLMSRMLDDGMCRGDVQEILHVKLFQAVESLLLRGHFRHRRFVDLLAGRRFIFFAMSRYLQRSASFKHFHSAASSFILDFMLPWFRQLFFSREATKALYEFSGRRLDRLLEQLLSFFGFFGESEPSRSELEPLDERRLA